ncbi:hypothetical protein [Streptomyces sp. NPDC059272]|uniref:hypothetical protein n=1 Tax=Streptomyces sp. NPDC059272 TaxID=3346800 RepID=UPI0036CECB4B
MSEDDDFFRDRAAASNTRRETRGYDIRRELHAPRTSTASPAREQPAAPPSKALGHLPHGSPAHLLHQLRRRHLPPRSRHNLSP